MGEFVYSTTDMISEEAQWCVRNNSAYRLRGDCRYCPLCENNICECRQALPCDWLHLIAAGTCFVVAAVLLVISTRSMVRHWHMEYNIRPYEVTRFKLEPW